MDGDAFALRGRTAKGADGNAFALRGGATKDAGGVTFGAAKDVERHHAGVADKVAVGAGAAGGTILTGLETGSEAFLTMVGAEFGC